MPPAPHSSPQSCRLTPGTAAEAGGRPFCIFILKIFPKGGEHLPRRCSPGQGPCGQVVGDSVPSPSRSTCRLGTLRGRQPVTGMAPVSGSSDKAACRARVCRQTPVHLPWCRSGVGPHRRHRGPPAARAHPHGSCPSGRAAQGPGTGPAGLAADCELTAVPL